MRRPWDCRAQFSGSRLSSYIGGLMHAIAILESLHQGCRARWRLAYGKLSDLDLCWQRCSWISPWMDIGSNTLEGLCKFFVRLLSLE
eukprot:756269-Amphidinium_carterae.1